MYSRAAKGNENEIGKCRSTDFYSRADSLSVVEVTSLQLGALNVTDELDFVVFKEGNPLESMEIDGIIGDNLLRHFVVRFDSRQKKMILSNSNEPFGLNEADAVPMKIRQGDPCIEVNLGNGIAEIVAFDTGSDELLRLRNTTYERAAEKGVVELLATGVSGGSMAAHGYAPVQELRSVKIPELSIGRHKMANVRTETFDGLPYSVIGVPLTNYGLVTLDYHNELFYFEPFDDAPAPADGNIW